MMLVIALLLFAAAGLGVTQMNPMTNCMATTPANPSCTVEYRPWMAPQIKPTSTVYDMIMTTYLNIIDCQYCTIKQVDDYPTAIGPFTAKVTLPVLTITRVGCMVETAAITRRGIRGYGEIDGQQPTAVEALPPKKRAVDIFDSLILADAESSLSLLSLDNLAALITDNVDPNNPDLRQQVAIYIKQLVSAQLAVNLCNSGFDNALLCDQSRTPNVRYRLFQANFNPQQVSDIVCFCSVFGLPLNATDAELQQQLTTSIYALQSSSEPGADISRLCQTVSIPFGPALQIDNSAIKAYVCSNGTSTTTSSAALAPMMTAFSGTAISVGSISSFATGESGSWANSTTWSWGVTGLGNDASTATGGGGSWPTASTWALSGIATGTGFATGEGGPWANSTGGTWGSTATRGGNGSESVSTVSGGWGTAVIASGSSGWVSNETGVVGGASSSAWATDSSWTGDGALRPTATGDFRGTGGSWTATGGTNSWGWNATGAVGTAPTPTGGSWSVTGAGWSAAASWTGTAEWSVTGNGWEPGVSWSGTAGPAPASSGWGFNETSAFSTSGAAATGWATGGSWTVAGQNNVTATGWVANATGTASAAGGWGTGNSWTATGGSWGSGVNGTALISTFTFGTGTFKTIMGTGTASDIGAIVIENATTITIQNGTRLPPVPTSSLSYAPWTTSTTSNTIFKRS